MPHLSYEVHVTDSGVYQAERIRDGLHASLGCYPTEGEAVATCEHDRDWVEAAAAGDDCHLPEIVMQVS